MQALCKWSNLLRMAPDMFSLFSSSTLSKLPERGDRGLVERLDLLFNKKSTNTLWVRPIDQVCAVAHEDQS